MKENESPGRIRRQNARGDLDAKERRDNEASG